MGGIYRDFIITDIITFCIGEHSHTKCYRKRLHLLAVDITYKADKTSLESCVQDFNN